MGNCNRGSFTGRPKGSNEELPIMYKYVMIQVIDPTFDITEKYMKKTLINNGMKTIKAHRDNITPKLLFSGRTDNIDGLNTLSFVMKIREDGILCAL